jgi:hypothetical protein
MIDNLQQYVRLHHELAEEKNSLEVRLQQISEAMSQSNDLSNMPSGNRTSIKRTGRPAAGHSRTAVKRRMSPAARRRMAESARKRWAAAKRAGKNRL